MASNRKVQRLLNEFMDLLSEYGYTETNPEQKFPTCSTAEVADQSNQLIIDRTNNAPPAIDQVVSDLTTKDQINPSLSTNDVDESAPPAAEPMDISYETNQAPLIVPVTDGSNSGQPETGAVNSVPPAIELN